MKSLRDQVLEVMRDGSRIDRFLEATYPQMPCDLYLTTKNTARTQFEVPVADGMDEDEEESLASVILADAARLLSDAD